MWNIVNLINVVFCLYLKYGVLIIITLFKSQWIETTTISLLIEETTNQTESQQIKSNVGFW